MNTSEARVLGSNLPVSTKQCREIAQFIKGREVQRAVQLLEAVKTHKVAIPFKRFNRDMGHRPGHVGPGRYPEKASLQVVVLLKSLIANAQQKGLDVNNLYVKSAIANIASRPGRYGRQRGRTSKRSHFEIIAAELPNERKETKKQKDIQKTKEKQP